MKTKTPSDSLFAYENFSSRIKTLRGKSTISKIARALKITPVEYSEYENATREPSLSILLALAKYFDTTTDYLLGLKESPCSRLTTLNTFNKDASDVLSRMIAIEAEAQRKRIALYKEIQGVSR